MGNSSTDNVLMNGCFARDSWSRVEDPAAGVECAVWRQTYAADRWKIRYANPKGMPVSQSWSPDAPAEFPFGGSLEIRGAQGVSEGILLGQRIEAAEAPRYKRQLRFSAWIFVSNPTEKEIQMDLVLGTALRPDVFGNPFNSNVKLEVIKSLENVPADRWTRVECDIDARAFSPNGLSVEMQFPASALNRTGSCIRVTGVALADAACTGETRPQPATLDKALAKRFFQRHDAASVHSLGRALAVTAHELYFQFSFTEMRAAPECTLPTEDGYLGVFSHPGLQYAGFAYDTTARSRGSVVIRASKKYHGLRDAYLSFAAPGAAIFLEAEL